MPPFQGERRSFQAIFKLVIRNGGLEKLRLKTLKMMENREKRCMVYEHMYCFKQYKKFLKPIEDMLLSNFDVVLKLEAQPYTVEKRVNTKLEQIVKLEHQRWFLIKIPKIVLKSEEEKKFGEANRANETEYFKVEIPPMPVVMNTKLF